MKRFKTLLTKPAMILRIGGGICFLGHGILALGGKLGFIGLLGSFGLDPAKAALLLKLIGCLDILVGLSILFKPNKRVLQWAMAWTALTIFAWGIHGDSLMDLARRVPYVTTPMALLFFIYNGKKSETGDLSGTQNIVEEEAEMHIVPSFSQGVLSKEQEVAIHDLDLSLICMKLMDPNEGEGWSSRQCEEVSREYKRFLTLRLLFPDEGIVPNLAIDTVWHYHILDTAAYYKDCQTIFGYFLHHYPYLGMQGSEDTKQFENAFDRTQMLYEKTFGSTMAGPDYLPSFQMRRSA